MDNLTGWNRFFTTGMLFLCISFCSVCDALALAGDPTVRLPRVRIKVSEAINAIEGQTGCVFSYNGDLFDVDAAVRFSSGELTLTEALDELVDRKRTAYMVRNRYIIIHPKETKGGRCRDRSGQANAVCTRTADELPTAPPGNSEQQETAAANQANLSLKPSFSSHTAPDFYPGNLSFLPVFAIKSNLLYAAGTITPNLAVEMGLGNRASLVFSGNYNSWNRDGHRRDNERHIRWVIHPEFRYWLGERFRGHYFGGNVFHVQFDIGGKDIPSVGFTKKKRYQGNAYGAGANWGYHIPFGNRCGVKFSAGFGIACINYRTHGPNPCGYKIKWYAGPTHAAVNVVFKIY